MLSTNTQSTRSELPHNTISSHDSGTQSDGIIWMNRSLAPNQSSSYYLVSTNQDRNIDKKSISDWVVISSLVLTANSLEGLLTEKLRFEPTYISLGYGGEGRVSEYKELSTNKLYAVKKMHRDKRILFTDSKGEVCGLFANHIEGVVSTKAIILQSIQNFFTVITSLEDIASLLPKDSYYIAAVVTEKIEGMTLKAYYQSVGIKKNENIIIQQISQTINQLHELHIMHRDIKPENIMICTDPYTKNIKTKLIDFGLSIKTDSQTTRRNSCKGTLKFIESCRFDNTNFYYDNNVDQWALGVTAIELIFSKSVVKSDFSSALKVDQAIFDLSKIKKAHHSTYIAVSKLEMLSDEEKTQWLLANSTGYTADSELVKFILTHTAPSMRSAKLESLPAI